MNIDLSKLCADFLRKNHSSQSTEKLKASHARELVAAFFGYQSHAALIAEKAYPLFKLEESYIFIPNIPLMNHRRSKLNELPNDLSRSIDLAKLLSDMLVDEGLSSGDVWLDETLEDYLIDVFLPGCQNLIDDQLSGVMAETNAGFFDEPFYDNVQIEERDDELIAVVRAQYKGEPVADKPFCGDNLDVIVQVTLPRMAGKRGFYDFELEVGGDVNDDWLEMPYGKVPMSRLASELGLTDEELELLEWSVHNNDSDDGLIYSFVLTFDESCPPEVLAKIEGLSDNLTISVSANAFDSLYPDQDIHYEMEKIRSKDHDLEPNRAKTYVNDVHFFLPTKPTFF